MTTSHATSYEPAKSNRVIQVLVLGALTALAPLSIDMYLPALPTLAGDMHTSASLAQLTLTACLLGLALGQLFAGPLSDARGRRGPLIAGLAIYAAASLLCVIAPSVWLLILLRFIQGASGAAGIVIARAIVRDLYSGSEMTKFFTLLMLVNGVAPILAPVTGGQLLRVTSWRGVFVVLGLLGIVMMLAVIFGLPETLAKEKRMTGGIKKTLSTLRNILGDRVFMGYAWSQGLILAAMFGYISGSPFVLQNIYGVSPQMFSVMFAINGLGIIIAGQITGRLSGRVGDQKLMRIGFGLAAICGVAILLVVLSGGSLIALMIPLFVIVSCVGIVSPTSTSLAMQSQGSSAGSAAALIGVPQLIAGAAVAPLVGLRGTHDATPMGFVIAACDVGAVIVYLLLTRKRQR